MILVILGLSGSRFKVKQYQPPNLQGVIGYPATHIHPLGDCCNCLETGVNEHSWPFGHNEGWK